MKLLVIGSHNWNPADDAVIADGVAMYFEGETEKVVLHMNRNTPFEKAVKRQIMDNQWGEMTVKPTALDKAVSMVDGCLVFTRSGGTPALKDMARQIEERVPVIEFTA